MTCSPDGLAVLKYFESCRLAAYPDSGGIWTVGWGHTGPDIKEGLVITQALADAWLVSDMAAETNVLPPLLAHVTLTTHQTDALIVFVYNIGIGAFAGSTVHRVLAVAGPSKVTVDMFTRWDKADVDGVLTAVAGLHRRRNAEFLLFMTPDSFPVTQSVIESWDRAHQLDA